jgi:patatin-like phospholipase/acyl hydrolase
VLSFDGGGVRGLASLIMLHELMEQVRREWERFHGTSHPDPIKPCEHFDLICGTSTGGLIALMLGRLRYVSVP